MAYERRSFAGGGAATTLTAGINSSVESFAIADGTNWPSGSSGDFFVVIDRGTPTEEKVRCQTLSTGTVAVRSGGRGSDGTLAQSHDTGATVELCVTALDLDEANAHLSNQQGDPHPMYLTATDGDATYLSITDAASDYQPLNSHLTTLAGAAAPGVFGLARLADANQAAARTALGIPTGPTANSISNVDTITSSTYAAAPTNAGPAVTTTIGSSGAAIVILSSQLLVNGSSTTLHMAFAVSGATTVAASDAGSLYVDTGSSPGVDHSASLIVPVAGLTPGSNTFTSQYRRNGSATSQVANRALVVIPV